MTFEQAAAQLCGEGKFRGREEGRNDTHVTICTLPQVRVFRVATRDSAMLLLLSYNLKRKTRLLEFIVS